MSKIFGTSVDFNLNDTSQFRVQNVISLPTPTIDDKGFIVYNTVDETPYLWTGTYWYNLGIGSTQVWRKSDLVTPADSYTEQIHHNGNVILNGVSKDSGYSNAFGSTKIGSIGISGNIVQTDGITSWLVLAGNQGVRIEQVNQNVGNIQIGKMSLAAMSGNQTNDTNVSMGRLFTSTSSQTSNPNWRNLTLNANVNMSTSVAATRSFHSIYVSPTLNGVDEHWGLNMSGWAKFREYGLGNINDTPAYLLAVTSGGKMVETALTGGGGIAGIEVQEDAVQVVASAQILNFTGPSVTVTDNGGVPDIEIAAEQPSGFEEVTENGNTGWRFIGQAAGDNIDRYYVGEGAFDAMWYDGTSVGLPDVPAKPYGTSSAGGINFGIDNKDAATWNTVVIGSTNQTTAYANAFMLGNYNNLGYGYGDAAIGSYHTITPSGVNSFLFAMGHNNQLKAQRGGAAIGLALINASRGSVVVGTSNVEWVGGEADAARPMFTVGIGTTTTPAGRWAQLVPKDGFNVHYDGTVIANSLTTTLIDAASNKVLITREYADANYSGGGGGNTVTGYVSDYEEAECKFYQGMEINTTPQITRTNEDGIVEVAQSVTDLSTDWPNRLNLTYV